MSNFTIGILGGMGTYATINLFEQYAAVFPAEKEWERPRIIIDNRCTMPSRVRAFLYGEKTEQLVDEMSDSMSNLSKAGCNRIILACNTSHLFLPQIYKKIPDIENKIINIINCCADKVKSDGVKKVYLLGSEGTIESKVYQKALSEVGIDCIVPEKEEYNLLRQCIEAVKQNKYTASVDELFVSLAGKYDACILGCTELPILYKRNSVELKNVQIFDPIYIALNKLKEEYDNE